jgi:hypothetical protein
LGLGELKLTLVTLQLADRFVKVPRGIIEDVRIKFDKFYYPVDFIVLGIELVVNLEIQIPVILGCPFLATANALINYRTRVMKLSFRNMTVELNIFDINMQPFDYERAKSACIIEEIVEQTVNEPSVEDHWENALLHLEATLTWTLYLSKLTPCWTQLLRQKIKLGKPQRHHPLIHLHQQLSLPSGNGSL